MAETVLRAFLFTDIAEATALKQRLGDGAGAAAIGQHDRLFRALLESFGGEEHENPGDGFFASFARPSDAVRCALEFQQSLGADATCRRLRIRCGIHMGESVRVTDDGGLRAKLLGLAVDAAARVMHLALPGQVLVTRHAFDSVRQQLLTLNDETRVHWLAHGPYQLKGVDNSIEIFEAALQGRSPMAAPPDVVDARRVLAAGEEETLGWRPAVGLAIPGRDAWELERKIGEGSFGEAWLARHRETRERRIFKFCFQAERLRSLKRELKLFRVLREVLGERPDIARLYEVRLSEPPYFLEMEYSDGGNLAEWTESRGGLAAIPLPERLGLFQQVADALAAAHSVGVIHRDVKPANILVKRAGEDRVQVQLSDFGIGEVVDATHFERLDLTMSIIAPVDIEQAGYHGLADTQRYLAPELLAGKPASERTDVYALGVLLFQLVVGDFRRPVAHGWEASIDDSVLREDIAACVAGEPDDRPANGAEVAARFRRLEARRSEHAAARRRAEREARRLTRGRAFGVAAGFLLLATGLLGWGWWRSHTRLSAAQEAADGLRADLAQAGNARAALVAQLEAADAGRRRTEREAGFWADVLAAGPGDDAVRNALAAAERRAVTLAGDPLVLARVRLRLGVAWGALEEFERAGRQLEEALEVAEYADGADGVLAVEVLVARGELELAQRAFASAAATLEEARERAGPRLEQDAELARRVRAGLALARAGNAD